MAIEEDGRTSRGRYSDPLANSIVSIGSKFLGLRFGESDSSYLNSLGGFAPLLLCSFLEDEPENMDSGNSIFGWK
jgi:hypothetical protein